MRPSSETRRIDLLGIWRKRARKVLDSGARSEIAVSAALEESYREGIQRAARFLAEEGFPDLADKVRALLDEGRGTG